MTPQPKPELLNCRIPLGSSGKFAIVDAADFELVSKYKWILHKGKYARATKKFGSILMHKLLVSDGVMRDHKDGDGLNNQRENLRPCSNQQNQFNRKARTSRHSKFKGIYFNRGKWVAIIYKDGNRKYLGRFKDKIEAAKAYDRAAVELFGEFANLNLP